MQEVQPLSAIACAPAAAVEPQPPVKCPRCESTNTKFCYYNNYNLSQPRHLCKNCRRYWTRGGALRNIPVGGGTHRKNSSSKRPNPAAISPSPTSSKRPSATSHHHPPPLPTPGGFHSNVAALDHDKMTSLDFTGSFSSLLHSNGHHFENNILDHHHSSTSSSSSSSSSSSPLAAASAGLGGDLNRNSNDDNLLTWANGWPDLAIYTPGSSFH